MTSLLPPNATTFERAMEATIARSTDLSVPIDTLWRADACPEALLPWLAWALSVDTWDSQWSPAIKRQMIANSIALHRVKGTRTSIRRILNTLNLQADIAEWFDYGGPPHTFRVTAWVGDQAVDGPLLDAALYRNLFMAINHTKPVRSHYQFQVGARFNATLVLGSQTTPVIYLRQTSQWRVQNKVAVTLSLPTAVQVLTLLRIDANTR